MNEGLLNNQTWLVSGTSSGIGYELVRQLLISGAHVVCVGRRNIDFECSDKCQFYEADITDFSRIDSIVRKITSELKIDVLVSNAGVSCYGDADKVSIDDIVNVINTNLIGSMVFIRAAIENMKYHGGKIIQIGSLNSQFASPKWSYYTASKYGVAGFCDSIRKELKDQNIQVMLVEPGTVNTPLWRKLLGDETEEDKKKLLIQKSVNADVSVEKLARRIIYMSRMEHMPEYLPLGSKAAKMISKELSLRLQEHKKLVGVAGDVDYVLRMKLPNKLDGRKLCIWPCGKETKDLILQSDWSAWQGALACFADSSVGIDGRMCFGKKVVMPKEVIEKKQHYYIIIGSEKYYNEIASSLLEHDFKEYEDFCLWRELVVEDE